MSDPTERIRHGLDRAAGPDEPSPDLDVLRRTVDLRRRRKAGSLVGIAVVAVVALGGLGWAAAGGGSSPQQLTAGPPPPGGPVTSDAPSTTVPDSTASSVPVTSPPEATTAPGSTTAPTPPVGGTTIPPTPTVPPARPQVWHLSGTHRGQGPRVETTRGECAVLSHKLDSVFTLTSGEAWVYHSDYCGTVTDGNQWSATGTFTFRTEAGDRVTGTLTSRAVLPSKGEPYDLDITGGTGAWSGAVGRCHLTNHMRDLPDGQQEQAGAFSCSIQPNGGGATNPPVAKPFAPPLG